MNNLWKGWIYAAEYFSRHIQKNCALAKLTKFADFEHGFKKITLEGLNHTNQNKFFQPQIKHQFPNCQR